MTTAASKPSKKILSGQLRQLRGEEVMFGQAVWWYYYNTCAFVRKHVKTAKQYLLHIHHYRNCPYTKETYTSDAARKKKVSFLEGF